jgi:hypothetical protein
MSGRHRDQAYLQLTLHSDAARWVQGRRRHRVPTLKAKLKRAAVKRPPKRPDRVYPLAKHQEYACVYDWEDRAR